MPGAARPGRGRGTPPRARPGRLGRVERRRADRRDSVRPPAIAARASRSFSSRSSCESATIGHPRVAGRPGPRRTALAPGRDQCVRQVARRGPGAAFERAGRQARSARRSGAGRSASKTISSAGQSRKPAAARGVFLSYSSRTAWKFVPPKPKALTPARRGRSSRAMEPRLGLRCRGGTGRRAGRAWGWASRCRWSAAAPCDRAPARR